MNRRRFLVGLMNTALVGPPLVRALAAMPFSNIALSDWAASPKIPAGDTFWIRTQINKAGQSMMASIEYPMGEFTRITFDGEPKKALSQAPEHSTFTRTSHIAKGNIEKLRVLQDLKPVWPESLVLGEKL